MRAMAENALAVEGKPQTERDSPGEKQPAGTQRKGRTPWWLLFLLIVTLFLLATEEVDGAWDAPSQRAGGRGAMEAIGRC